MTTISLLCSGCSALRRSDRRIIEPEGFSHTNQLLTHTLSLSSPRFAPVKPTPSTSLAILVDPHHPHSLPHCVVRGYAAHHEEESFDAFNSRYVGFFDAVEDLFELQRGLNNCFAYDLVPSPEVIEAALRASRRVNDYSTAVRIFEGIKQKVENENQYKQYVEALKGVREELGIKLKEEMYSS